jgi:hypothetical protein
MWNLPWPELLIPPYNEVTLGSWRLAKFLTVPQAGYFDTAPVVGEPVMNDQYVLLTPDDTWMSTARNEIESQAPHVAAAYGHVVVMGAGMGVALYNILGKPEVTRVTQIERDPRVIDLLHQAASFEEWPGSDKLEIQIVDAFDYRPNCQVDLLYVDIWARTGDPQALPDTQRIQAHVGAGLVGWWTQEIHFLRWLNQKGFVEPPTLDQYRAWTEEIDLPLVGRDEPAYVSLVPQVARSPQFQIILQQEGATQGGLCQRI